MDTKTYKEILKFSKTLSRLGVGKGIIAGTIIFLFLATLIYGLVFNKSQQQKIPQAEVQGTLDEAKELTVSRVIDGDTIEIDSDGQRFTIRFIGVNTPETVKPNSPVECFGKEASEFNKKLLTDKKVILEEDIQSTDRYGRLLRYVYLKNESGELQMINKILVEEGYAFASTYAPNVKYQEIFRSAETQARENKKGLWAECE